MLGQSAHVGTCASLLQRPVPVSWAFTLSTCALLQWFSQGCTIGCPTCTGIGSHTDQSLCPNPTTTATLPTHAWTMNRGATPGSANDSYRFNPWRAPGTAPVNDAW